MLLSAFLVSKFTILIYNRTVWQTQDLRRTELPLEKSYKKILEKIVLNSLTMHYLKEDQNNQIVHIIMKKSTFKEFKSF